MPLHSFAPFAFLCHCGLGWKRDGHCTAAAGRQKGLSLSAFLAFLFRPKTHLPPPTPILSSLDRSLSCGQLSISTPFIGERAGGRARWKYPGTYRWRATAFHDICCPAAGTALSIAKGQMGEKPCSGSPSLLLPSRLLRPPTPLHRRGGCEKEAIHALYHSSRAEAAWQAALSSVMASNGIGNHTPSLSLSLSLARSLGLPTPASNGWIGVSSSVSQRPSELQSLLPRSPSLILSFLQCVELKGKCPVRSIRIVSPPPPPFLLSLLLRRRRRLLIRINTELTFLLLHYQDMDRRCLRLMLPFYLT